MKHSVLVLFALLAPAGSLRAQDGFEGRLDEGSARAVQAILRQAQSDGLPVEPLRSKVLEGLSKGADGPRIVEAVRRLQQHLQRASVALGTASTAAELVAAVAALNLGVPDASLTALRTARPDGSVASALVGLAYLVQRGAPPDRSVELVRDLLAARVTDADFLRFRRLVEQDVRAGAPAAGAAEARARPWIRPGSTPLRVPEAPW